MISMILLVRHLVDATNEDEARPQVTGGPSIILIELPRQTSIPNYRTADQKGRAHSLNQLAIEEQTE